MGAALIEQSYYSAAAGLLPVVQQILTEHRAFQRAGEARRSPLAFAALAVATLAESQSRQ